MQNEAWNDGADSWDEAGTDAANPHEPGTVEHREWQAGYEAARAVELGA